MSDADRDEVVVSDGDLTVRKSIDADRFQTLAVVFDVTSDMDGPVRVQLTDTIPDGVPMDDVGFHPEYGSEHWATEDGRVVFERTLDPGESYTTIYGVRDADEGAGEVLLGSPELDIIDAEGAGGEPAPDVPDEIREIDDLISEDRSDAVRDVISGASESLAGEEAAPGGPRPEAAGADGAGTPSPEPADPAGDGGEAEDAVAGGGDEVTVPVTGGVARVLAKELREGAVSRADREALRDALAFTEGSTDARIRHLQSAVGDLEAYTDALADFLDEEGGAEAVLGDVRSDVDAVRREVGRVEDDLDGVAGRLDELEDAVADLAEGLDALDGVGRRVGTVEGRVEDLSGDVETLRDDLDAMDEFRERLSKAFEPGGTNQG